MCGYESVCMCVCLCAGEKREKEREEEERERERERECVCVYECVKERERENVCESVMQFFDKIHSFCFFRFITCLNAVKIGPFQYRFLLRPKQTHFPKSLKDMDNSSLTEMECFINKIKGIN